MQTNKIKSEKENHELVRIFFDDHAPSYREKYRSHDPFYQYFFLERLRKAVDRISVGGKMILDIGAGTGSLYDYLAALGKTNFAAYDATDISSGMLAQSTIPLQSQYVGDLLELDLYREYDLIFMLGVSTYLTEDKLVAYLDRINQLLIPGGQFVISFTNGVSLDILLRRLLSPFVQSFSGKDKIISQNFETRYYSQKEIKDLLSERFEIQATVGLNHTFFPVSRIFKRFSVKLADRISHLKEGRIKSILSSDLLVTVKSKNY